MEGIRVHYPPPRNEHEFLQFSVRLLRRMWNRPKLEPYGHGEEQFGVDIFDPSGTKPAWAAQCKSRLAWKTIQPSEIRQEVELAKSFPHRLDRYTIITSAKRSREAQDTVLKLNQEHSEKGLFEVELLDWNWLEDWFDENPGVYEACVGPAGKQLKDAVAGEHSGVVVSVDPESQDTKGDKFHAEIDEAKSLLVDKHQFEAARVILERLRTRHWDELSPRHRYRLLGNIGSSYLEEGNLSEAARYFIEAKSHQPSDEHARTNEAIAYELLDNPTKAFELASEILKEAPNASRARALRIRNAPPELSLQELEKEVPEQLKRDGEVLLALAIRSWHAHDPANAERFAREASEVATEWPPVWALLGQAILAQEWEEERPFVTSPEVRRNTPRVQEANGYLNKAIDLARVQRSNRMLADALLYRSVARKFLGDAAADDDIREAYRLSPSNPAVLMKLASIEHNSDQAIVFLRQATQCGGGDQAEFLLAIAIREIGKPEQLKEAATLFENVARNPDAVYRREALGFAVRDLCKLGQCKEALDLLDSVGVVSPLTNAFMAALRGYVFYKQEITAVASEQADLALAGLTPASSRDDRRDTATLLLDLQRYDEALPILQQLANPEKLTPDTNAFISCARQLERDGLVLEFCQKLRLAGIDAPWVLHQELDLLQRYDIEQAIRVLKDHLAKRPDDRIARLRLSFLGVLVNQPELVTTNLDELPGVASVTPDSGAVVMRVLHANGKSKEAIEYGYQLLRRHFNNADVHVAYFTAVMFGDRKEELLGQSGIAGPGAAVCFVEHDDSPERWLVIEDSDTCYPSLNEVRPSDHLAQRFTGKRAGETVVMAEACPVNRTATIKKVVHKCLYRLWDCMEQYQLRFPDKPWLIQARFKKVKAEDESDTLDFGPLLELINQLHEQTENAQAFYVSHWFPIHAFGKLVGEWNAFRSVYHLASRERVQLKCCLGHGPERDEALSNLRGQLRPIIDLTAIATLSLLERLDFLKTFPVKPLVGQATLVELKELALHVRLYDRPGGRMCKADAGYAAIDLSEEVVERWREHIAHVVAKVEEGCEVASGLPLAAVAPETRLQTVELFGQHGAESIVLASRPGFILWTDDLELARFAQQQFAVRRVWTQTVFLAAVEAQRLEASVLNESSAKLFGFRYDFTFLNTQILEAAARLAEWDPDRWPLKQTIDSLGNERVKTEEQFQIVGEFIASVFSDPAASFEQERVVSRLLDRMGKRNRGLRVVQDLARQLPRFMAMNPLRAHEAERFVRSWLATSKSIVRA